MAGNVKVRDLVKSYGSVQAVRGLSFDIADGEIFGILGPNGAGKTTTLECVIGLRDPDGGSIEVCGIDRRKQPQAVKQRIGAVLQSTLLQDKITPREALDLFGSFYNQRAETKNLLERFSLNDKADAHFQSLSGGQKQRLAIALAMVNEPDFLLLDEPTAGLDPQSRRELHSVIKQMRGDGRTVLITTHYMDEAEQLCDRIAIVDHGTIIAQGSPRELVAKAQSLPRIVFNTAQPLNKDRLKTLAAVRGVDISGESCALSSAKVSDTIIDLVKYIEADKNELLDLHIKQPSLEDVFIELTGRSLRD
jgi:ABC-2 type transport system ATP-binding protein